MKWVNINPAIEPWTFSPIWILTCRLVTMYLRVLNHKGYVHSTVIFTIRNITQTCGASGRIVRLEIQYTCNNIMACRVQWHNFWRRISKVGWGRCLQGRKSMLKHGGDNIGEKYTSRLRDVLRFAPRLARGFGGMLLWENFFKWCNLVRFDVYLDQILSLQNFKSYHFLYKK